MHPCDLGPKSIENRVNQASNLEATVSYAVPTCKIRESRESRKRHGISPHSPYLCGYLHSRTLKLQFTLRSQRWGQIKLQVVSVSPVTETEEIKSLEYYTHVLHVVRESKFDFFA